MTHGEEELKLTSENEEKVKFQQADVNLESSLVVYPQQG